MVVHRLSFTTLTHWDYHDTYRIQKKVGKTDRPPLEKQIFEYSLPFSLPDLKAAQKLSPKGKNFSPLLHETLKLVGPYADLWIDTCKGKVAPPEVLPQGWTYPNNEPVPEQYFWLWYPDEFTNRSLTSQANSSLEDRIFNSAPSIFKSSIPTHLQNRYGEMKSIPAIEIYQLPGMIKHGLQWHFDFKK